jgi:hypothetical protein
MRNYFKIHGCLVKGFSSHGNSHNFDVYVWADTKKVLESRIAAAKLVIESTDPAFTFTYELNKVAVYFELNKANFAVVLNGGANFSGSGFNLDFAKYVWDAISFLPAGNVDDNPPTGFFDKFVVAESPRKSWSHGH